MKTLIAAFCLLAGATAANAGSVDGYFRNNGTYVAPHYRSNSNGSVTDNYSYKGNSNPYSGSTGTSKYGHDTTSPYFNGTPGSNGKYGHSGNRW
ncbi:hypothetical protein KX729_30595 [Rhizobium sp. XQZ8]|uniref:hypothetical protein n=1 Tax=Rhizobium populisoli TaxID=2859785 RepID=UPI001CA48E86|nr:hypothetical protein [Rhizobium populisoli]MBW6425744.1 hypothetical protein [Rhizobium populisoli]